MIPLLSLGTAVFVADQITKAWALGRLKPGQPQVVLPDLLDLTLVLNPGVAFGIFAGVPPEWRWVVMAFSLSALVLLCSLAARAKPNGGWVAIGLVLGGAVGNLLDRWRLGAVVDFVDLHWRGYHWPAFNVADSAITVGVALVAADLLLGGWRERRRDPADA